MALVVKNLPANAGDTGDTGSIPGSERSPGVGNGNPLQYSYLENPNLHVLENPRTEEDVDGQEGLQHRNRIEI